MVHWKLKWISMSSGVKYNLARMIPMQMHELMSPDYNNNVIDL